MDAGYAVQRVSGTSAGSIVGAVVAAAAQSGKLSGSGQRACTATGLQQVHRSRHVERVPLLGPSLALVRGNGIYRGDYVRGWVHDQLKSLGVTTFGDLALDDDQLPPDQRYRLVVTVSDVTTGQLVRLPWDYRRVYGLDPDEQSVADAVRASMSIPFFFRPVTLTSATGLTSTLMDGGLLSNFPIDSLDRRDGGVPRWPSFGVTVLPNLPQGNDRLIPALDACAGSARRTCSRTSSRPFWWAVTRLISTSRGSAPRHPGKLHRRRVPRFRHLRRRCRGALRQGSRRGPGVSGGWNWQAYLRRFR